MRRLTVLVIGLITGAVLTGCSNQTVGNPAPAGTAGSSGLVRYASMAELSAAVNRQIRADQTVSYKLTSALPTGGAVAGDGALRIDSAGTATKFQMDIQVPGEAPQQIGFVLLPPTEVYVQLPAAARPPGSKPWFKIDPNGTDPLSKAIAPNLNQLQDTIAPVDYLQRLGTATITDVSDDAVDGTSTLRYTLHVDLTNSADPGAASLRAGGTNTIDPQVWIGEKGRLVKFVLAVTVSGAGKVESTARYTDWGKPVDIVTPPADQVGAAGG